MGERTCSSLDVHCASLACKIYPSRDFWARPRDSSKLLNIATCLFKRELELVCDLDDHRKAGTPVLGVKAYSQRAALCVWVYTYIFVKYSVVKFWLA